MKIFSYEIIEMNEQWFNQDFQWGVGQEYWWPHIIWMYVFPGVSIKCISQRKYSHIKVGNRNCQKYKFKNSSMWLCFGNRFITAGGMVQVVELMLSKLQLWVKTSISPKNEKEES
jgi:hypothetical protein